MNLDGTVWKNRGECRAEGGSVAGCDDVCPVWGRSCAVEKQRNMGLVLTEPREEGTLPVLE